MDLLDWLGGLGATLAVIVSVVLYKKGTDAWPERVTLNELWHRMDRLRSYVTYSGLMMAPALALAGWRFEAKGVIAAIILYCILMSFWNWRR